MKIKLKEIKNFDKDSDVVVVPPYVEVPEGIKSIVIPSFKGFAIVKSHGKFSRSNLV